MGHHPQEVYVEVDVRLGPQYNIEGNDTDRWLWFLSRDGDKDYGSTDGNGFSNAIGTTVTRGQDAPDGYYNLFHYTYDGRGESNFQPLDVHVPHNEWFTLGVYCRCNDPGQSNAVYKTYVYGELVDTKSGFMTSANEDAWVGEVGMLGYYIDYGSGAKVDVRHRHFDDHKIWVDDDIPDAIRE